MSSRPLAALAVSAGVLVAVACGSTTSVTTPSSFDAGCADPSVVRDGAPSEDAGVPEAGALQCPTGVCNYQTQAGCSANQACRPQFTATSTAVNPGCEAAGTGTSGSACAKGSDCAVGYYCASDAQCHKQCCDRDWSACDPGESCFRQLLVKAGGVVTDSGMDLCFPVGGCDLLDPKSCATGLVCTIVDPTGAVACVPGGTAQPGEVCSATAPCAAGARCIEGSDGDPSRCRAFCRAELCGDPVCGPDQGICTRYDTDPPGVGECTPG